MKLSIIIVTWNSSATLGRCISAILTHVRSGAFEIIVVDNDSQDKTYLEPYRTHNHVILLENPANLGFAKANNIGAKTARGEYCLILNPDVYLVSDPFPALISALEENPEIAAVGPLLINETGAPQVEGYYYKFPTFLQTLLVRTWLTRMAFIRRLALEHCHSKLTSTGLNQVEQIPGAFLLFKRAQIPRDQILNEAYFIWMEDVDFCRGIADSGRKVAVLQTEKAIHVGGTSFRSWSNQRKIKTAFISYATYLRLHHGPGRYLADHFLLLANYAFVLMVLASRSLFRLDMVTCKNAIRDQLQILGLIARSLGKLPRTKGSLP